MLHQVPGKALIDELQKQWRDNITYCNELQRTTTVCQRMLRIHKTLFQLNAAQGDFPPHFLCLKVWQSVPVHCFKAWTGYTEKHCSNNLYIPYAFCFLLILHSYSDISLLQLCPPTHSTPTLENNKIANFVCLLTLWLYLLSGRYCTQVYWSLIEHNRLEQLEKPLMRMFIHSFSITAYHYQGHKGLEPDQADTGHWVHLHKSANKSQNGSQIQTGNNQTELPILDLCCCTDRISRLTCDMHGTRKSTGEVQAWWNHDGCYMCPVTHRIQTYPVILRWLQLLMTPDRKSVV